MSIKRVQTIWCICAGMSACGISGGKTERKDDEKMEIKVTEEKGKKLMKVEGRIDTTTASEFEKNLLEMLESTDHLQIDMEKVVYVSSAGLRAFLNGQKLAGRRGAEMVIFNVTDTVMRIFEMTGFIDILTVE